MKVIKTEKKLCPCCMEEHDIMTVCIKDETLFKNEIIEYESTCMYCNNTDEFFLEEDQISKNDIKIKDIYRKKKGLLTSTDIISIRSKYEISQNDLSLLLGWGSKTITRYESHQIQDKAHNSILEKIENDPEWFIYLLENAKNSLSDEAYKKYLFNANKLYEQNKDLYIKKAIEASYINYTDKGLYNGNTILSLDKVVETIKYFASSKDVNNLYDMKLIKLIWYTDSLSFKRRGYSITGLVYKKISMGTIPVGYNFIINLSNIPCEEVDIGETIANHFSLSKEEKYKFLNKEDIKIMDEVIRKLGNMTKKEMLNFMYEEKAYLDTAPGKVIKYSTQ